MKRQANITTSRSLLPTAALLSVLLASAGLAAEDAGTTSVLAQGVGNRALAMGGAFGAVADDASGWMWNPAGLGRITRAELQLSHSELSPIALSEQFLGYALPSWRWGTASVAYRQLGVSGIDQRDDRNAVVGEALSARESEFALAYALAPSSSWSLGLATRVRRQELAGRSANALGVDLGAQLAPASLWARDASGWDGLRMGLSIRNAVQPAMRLDQDAVPDPRALRLGIAYQRPLAGLQSLLMALDMERVEGVSPRVQAGLEWRVFPSLDARAGLDMGRVTAGLAMRARGLSVDYAFTDHALEAQHRLGLSFAFGATVSDARLAAARAHEAELERNITTLFESRQAEQSRLLRTELEASLQANDPAAAREALGMLRALHPDDVSLRQLEAGVLVRLARYAERTGDHLGATGQYRQALVLAPGDSAAIDGLRRSESAAVRPIAVADSLAGVLRSALDAFGRGAYAESRRSLDRLVRASPADTQARALLERVDRGIASRADAIGRRATRAMEAGDLAEGERALTELRGLDPANAAISSLSSALERAKRAVRAAPTPERASVPVREDIRRLAEQHFARALSLLRSGQRVEALRWLEIARSEHPEHVGVARVLIQEYQVQGLEAFAAGRLQSALDLWRRAQQVDPNNARTLAYLTRAREHIARTNVAEAE